MQLGNGYDVRHSCYVYIYIYIYMCVCVCVRVRSLCELRPGLGRYTLHCPAKLQTVAFENDPCVSHNPLFCKREAR